MKPKKSSTLTGIILSFWLSFSGVGCLVSAFSLRSVDYLDIGFMLLAICIALALWLRFVKKDWPLLPVLMLVGYLLWREGSVLLSLEKLVSEISKVYDMGYGWGVLSWSGRSLRGIQPNGGLILVGLFVALPAVWTVVRAQWSGFALLPAFLPLLACCIVTDTVPDASWLFSWLTGVVLLVMTQSVRRKNHADATRLTAILLIPVLLAGWLLFGQVSEDNYDDQINDLTKQVMEWVDGLSIWGNHFSVTGPELSDSINLSEVGPMDQSHAVMMTAIYSNSQVMYLRGRGYEYYDGFSWGIEKDSKELATFWPESGQTVGVLSVEHRAYHSTCFFPYYHCNSEMTDFFRDGRWYYPDRPQAYHFTVYQPTGRVYEDHELTDKVMDRYTQLPDSTRTAAQKILQEHQLVWQGSHSQTAEAIGQYVSTVAEYDLNTGYMPAEKQDFAIWFLTESSTGYCTHFATAAAVLLRAAGIPARLANGYCFKTEANRRVLVTADQAHAWVEYLDPYFGWRVLDPTPEEWMDPDPTEPPKPTEPQTQPTETQTQPTETQTQPTETQTRPTESQTRPTELQTTPSTAPTAPVTQQPVEKEPLDLRWLWYPAAALLLAFLGWLRVWIGRKKLRSGTPNQRGLVRWRLVRKLCRLLRLNAPQRLQELAEKATFSQYQLSPSELAEFDQWIDSTRKILKKKLGIFHWVVRWIYAI